MPDSDDPSGLLDAVLDRAGRGLDSVDTGGLLDRVLDPDGFRDRQHHSDDTPAPADFAEETKVELSALEVALKDRKRAERDRFRAATDSEYWFAVCFTSRAEKEKFLVAAQLMDTVGDKYLDGRQVAAVLGIEMGDA